MATTSSVNTTHTPATSFDPVVQAALDTANVGAHKSSTELTADDFLKLLTVQLQNQDPLKPMEDTAFMGQMAQFAGLQQTRDLNTSFTKFETQQSTNAAAQFIGMKVTLSTVDAAGNPIVGVVSAVKIDSAGANIVVNGTSYATDLVTQVEAPTTTDIQASSH